MAAASEDVFARIDAPKFFDFTHPHQDTEVDDAWFETKRISDSLPSPMKPAPADPRETERVAKPYRFRADPSCNVPRNRRTKTKPFSFVTETRRRPTRASEGAVQRRSRTKSTRRSRKKTPLSLTHPQPFRFRTEMRAALKPHEPSSSEDDLRSHSLSKKPMQLTMPKEFRFATEQRFGSRQRLRASSAESKSEFQAHHLERLTLTRPKAFKFATEQRLGPRELTEPSVHEERHQERKPGRLTRPVGFQFATDLRLGPAERELRNSDDEQHSADLEEYSRNGRFIPSLTQPISPKFATDVRLGPREHRPKEQEPSDEEPEQEETHFDACKVTVPKTPHFRTQTRTRPRTFKSRAETEAEELEEIRNYQFKALPLNRDILEGTGSNGLRMVKKAPLTEPSGFHFSTDDRIALRRAERQMEHQQEEKPSKRRRKRRPIPGTKEPFALATEERGANKKEMYERRREEEERAAAKARHFKAQPLPVFDAPAPRVAKKPLTKPHEPPLKTEQRGALKVDHWKRKQQEEESEAKKRRQFRARPILEVSHPMEPAPAKKPLTKPTLPPLKTEVRGEHKVSVWLDQQFKEEQERKAAMEFKARPFALKEKRPYEPHPSNKEPTQPQPLRLQSDQRSLSRKVFDDRMNRKAKAARKARLLRQEERRRQEQKEIKKMRKKMVHKARPIHQPAFLPKIVAPKSLTEPSTPNFASFKTRLGRGKLERQRRALGDRTNRLRNGW